VNRSPEELGQPVGASGNLGPIEDPLESMLDEVSDEEFGEVSYKDETGTVANQRVKLAQWTAADFSSIYVRFRPHLERHARRFLSNQSQVDEVVQDAFLYLMVSLPELDSEIGVLRFLKWKTRLLAIDVIRASGRAYLNSIDEIPEPESSDPEISAHLEQQDDAAVVKLALSKLNPRHREVLIASMYEEKSTEEIASQVGLSENATRQLIFRARSAFKKALVGDIDTTGMSAGAILSVAARKAASESKKIGAAAMAIIGLLALSLAFIPGLQNTPTDQLAESSEQPEASALAPIVEPEAVVVEPEPESAANGSAEAESTAPSTSSPAPSPSASTSATPSATPSPSASRLPASSSLAGANTTSTFLFTDQLLLASGKNSESVNFVFNPGKRDIFSQVSFAIKSPGFTAQATPTITSVLQGQNRNNQDVYLLTAETPFVFDSKLGKWVSAEAGKGKFLVAVTMNRQGDQVESVGFDMAPLAN
jgi:RNA polymerase sigma factor (sigma-70 family)